MLSKYKYKQDLKQVSPRAITTPSATARPKLDRGLAGGTLCMGFDATVGISLCRTVATPNYPAQMPPPNENCKSAFSSGCPLGTSAYSRLQKAEEANKADLHDLTDLLSCVALVVNLFDHVMLDVP